MAKHKNYIIPTNTHVIFEDDDGSAEVGTEARLKQLKGIVQRVS